MFDTCSPVFFKFTIYTIYIYIYFKFAYIIFVIYKALYSTNGKFEFALL